MFVWGGVCFVAVCLVFAVHDLSVAILLSTHDILLYGTMTATIVMMSAALGQKKWPQAFQPHRIAIACRPKDDRIGFSANERTDECPLDGLRTTPEARVLCPTQLMFLQAMVLEERPEWHLQVTYCRFASCRRTMQRIGAGFSWIKDCLTSILVTNVILSVHCPSLAFV